ncbi:MAG: hypothetical protein AAFP84_19470 [Actinomycetota bacterium]
MTDLSNSSAPTDAVDAIDTTLSTGMPADAAPASLGDIDARLEAIVAMSAPSARPATAVPTPGGRAVGGDDDRALPHRRGADRVDPGSALSRLPRVPFEAVLGLGVVIILLVAVAFLAVSSASDAAGERDDANAALSAARDGVTDRDARIETLEAELAAATESATIESAPTESATTESAVVEAATAPSGGRLADAGSSTSQVDETTTDETTTADAPSSAAAALAEVTAELEAERERTDLLRNELEVARNEAAAAADAAGEPAPASLLVGDDFARLLGELAASADGLELSVDESRCVGRYLLDEVGLDGLGAGLHSGRTTSSSTAVVDALLRGALACDVDPALVVG